MFEVRSLRQKVRPEFARALSAAGVALDSATGRPSPSPSASLDELILTHASRSNKITYHPSPTDSYQALLAAIANAKHSFHIETFIWHDDESGRAIAQALVAKLQQAKAKGETFDAKVLIDSMGIRSGYGTKDQNILEYLQANGVDARLFNPGYVNLGASGLTPLSHRKLFIADGQKYLTGGRNIGNEYLLPQYETKYGDPSTSETSWQDFLMTVEGEEAATIEADFYQNWRRAGGTAPAELPAAQPVADGHTKLQTFVTDPIAHRYEILEAHTKAIANAKKDIFLISPYVADDELVEALINAKKANTARRAQLLAAAKTPAERSMVDQTVPELHIRILVPQIGEKGKDLNYQANLATAEQLLAAGIEIRLGTGGVLDGQPVERFSHLKAMEIDGQLLSLGSANADHRTYYSNHELVNILSDPAMIREFEERIGRPDWEIAKPIDQAWLKAHTSWWEKILRRIFEWLDFLY